MMKKIVGFVCILAGFSAPMLAQQDMGGEKAFQNLVKEYQLGTRSSVAMLRNYLDSYPDSRHANEVRSFIGSSYYANGQYGEAISMLKSCDLEDLPDEQRDNAILQLATSYLKVNDIQEAKIWNTMLQSVSKHHQNDASYNLAYIAYKEKQYDKALGGFQALRQDKEYASLVPYFIGEIQLQKKNYAAAQATAQEYLQQFNGQRDEAQMQRILGQALVGQNRFQDAVQPLERYCSAIDQPQRKALYDLGMSYFHSGVFSKAAETLGRATSVGDALSQNAYLNMGLAYLNLKERNQARMAFEQASITDFDKNVKEQALYNYALTIHETSYSPFAESVTVFERFLNEFPQSAYTEKVNDYLVETYMNTRSYDAALQSIGKIKQPGARIMGAKQKLLFRMGTQSFANADFRQAINYFDQSLNIGQYDSKTKADAYYWRGESNYRLENYAQAQRDFQQYVSTAPDKNSEEYGLALYNLGYTLFKQKNYSRAQGWFNQFVNRGGQSDKNIVADAYNRIGDCNFYGRQFEAARQNYNKAVGIDPSLGDYSVYQEAFVQGLQRNYPQKIQTLNRLLKNYPESQYIDDALYEQGRAFVQLEDNANAIERYQLLLQKFPESVMARKAANEIGLLYYQDDKYPQAIQAYKNVIKNYPGSEEARLAQRDLKSIYIDLNRVDEYASFASTIPGGTNFDVNERDSLTFVAAERVYMRGNMPEARESFTRYLQTFPEGAFSLDANYYIGLIDYNNQQYASADEHLDKVLAFPNNKFSEEAMLMSGEMAYRQKNFEKALLVYKQLKEKASTPERRQDAKMNILRCVTSLSRYDEMILAATDVLSETKISPELANEAHYDRAAAYVNSGKPEGALADWRELAKDTRNVYGAEAKYRLAQAYFDAGNTNAAEKEVLDYIEVSTPHAYWLARSFVLLSDVYKKMGRTLDAKQYLLSLQQNYQADDDIADMIKDRLNQLK